MRLGGFARCSRLSALTRVLVSASAPQALNWSLCPETPISWLKLYAQVEAQTDQENFLVPQFSQELYIQITQVETRTRTL